MLNPLHPHGLALLLVWVLAATPFSARSATIKTYTSGSGQSVVLLSGEITTGDADRFAKLVEGDVQKGQPRPSLSLNSQGGLFFEGIKLAQAIRRLGLTTYVEEGAICASVCFLIFAAGQQKFASYSSRIGVHSAKDTTGDANRAAVATKAMGRLLQSLDVSPAVINKMATTPQERIAWLSTPELQSSGVKPLRPFDSSPLERVLPEVTEQGPPASMSEPEKLWLWNRLVRTASHRSAEQNGGRARVSNACAPGAPTCTSTVSYTNTSGLPVALRTTRDRSGSVKGREVCDNRAAEAQTCRPWARGE
jgi:hypothetical protein